MLFSITTKQDWTLHQFNVNSAFLHGDLKEEVYMIALPHFESNFQPNEVWKLKKALYGLKQSHRAWVGKFSISIKQKYGYKHSNANHTLFLKRKGDLITCLIIYGDDMIITWSDREAMSPLRRNLFADFKLKDIGNLKYFLRNEVLRSRKGIYISQRKYILDLLAEVGLMDCKPTEILMVPNHVLKIVDRTRLTDRESYQQLVGKLIYVSHTGPGIAYVVEVVS